MIGYGEFWDLLSYKKSKVILRVTYYIFWGVF